MRQFNLLWIGVILIIYCLSCEKNDNMPEVSLINKWKLFSITNTSNNQITNVPAELDLTVEFKDSSEIFSAGVCNTGRGTYSIKGDSLTIECFFTEMWCLKGIDYIQWEYILSSNLYYAHKFVLTGDNLFLKSKGDYNLSFELKK